MDYWTIGRYNQIPIALKLDVPFSAMADLVSCISEKTSNECKYKEILFLGLTLLNLLQAAENCVSMFLKNIPSKTHRNWVVRFKKQSKIIMITFGKF